MWYNISPILKPYAETGLVGLWRVWKTYDNENPDISIYIKNWLEPQINWYNSKAKYNTFRYHVLQLLTIGFAALIPIINVFEGAELSIRIISAILGSMIVAIAGIIQLTKAQESWLLYRSTAEFWSENIICIC